MVITGPLLTLVVTTVVMTSLKGDSVVMVLGMDKLEVRLEDFDLEEIKGDVGRRLFYDNRKIITPDGRLASVSRDHVGITASQQASMQH